ncbi:MAG: hypothetical protein ACPGLY_16655 [Rubripirellula sp.]
MTNPVRYSAVSFRHGCKSTGIASGALECMVFDETDRSVKTLVPGTPQQWCIEKKQRDAMCELSKRR